MEKSRAESILQRLKMMAHHGRRDAAFPGGSGQAARVNDPDKYFHGS